VLVLLAIVPQGQLMIIQDEIPGTGVSKIFRGTILTRSALALYQGMALAMPHIAERYRASAPAGWRILSAMRVRKILTHDFVIKLDHVHLLITVSGAARWREPCNSSRVGFPMG
jgi:hypothetical protein